MAKRRYEWNQGCRKITRMKHACLHEAVAAALRRKFPAAAPRQATLNDTFSVDLGLARVARERKSNRVAELSRLGPGLWP